MIIDLVMISRLGKSDGGRETWLRNFLTEIGARGSKVEFNIFSLNKRRESLVDDFTVGASVVSSVNGIECPSGRGPVFLWFLLSFVRKYFFKKKVATHVIAVGGLEEAISVVLSYMLRPVSGKRILWLRTIYTKEKGHRLNKFTQKLLLAFEIFLIKNFFDLVIANGHDTAEFYTGHGINCRVIPNSIDLRKWQEIKTSESPVTRVAFIGRLSEVKGLLPYLDSIKASKESIVGGELEFHVVGDGSLEGEVLEFERDGLLTYHGSIANEYLPSFLVNVDCCVALTYLKDFMGGGGVSNALLEQMAAGMSIISWNNTIFTRVLDENAALMVEQDDIAGLAASYLKIHREPERAEARKIICRQLSNRYSIGNHVNLFFKEIEGLS